MYRNEGTHGTRTGWTCSGHTQVALMVGNGLRKACPDSGSGNSHPGKRLTDNCAQKPGSPHLFSALIPKGLVPATHKVKEGQDGVVTVPQQRYMVPQGFLLQGTHKVKEGRDETVAVPCTFSLWWPLVCFIELFQNLLLLFLREEARLRCIDVLGGKKMESKSKEGSGIV